MGAEDLFTTAADDVVRRPLAARMRPAAIDELVGQQHLLREGSPLQRLIGDLADENAAPASVLLWGPPGSGKTTLAHLVAATGRHQFVELSAVSAGIKDVRAAIDEARRNLGAQGRSTVLFVDEVHRFSKTQQDALLPAVENGWVTLIAATTENPVYSVVTPLLSRSLLLVLEELTDDDIRHLVRRALEDPRGFGGVVTIDEPAEDMVVRLASGDARRALTALEAAAGAAGDGGIITMEVLDRTIDRALVRYDRAGDQHFDVSSALIKSIRGSDVDAALHYLARMVEAGEDPRFIARRLMILASEDIGLADPTALTTAVAAAQASALIGFPEARLPLAQAVIALALAPKSNAVIRGIDAALADVRAGGAGPVPLHLRDAHSTGNKKLGHGREYVYPHDQPGGVVRQQYAPDSVTSRRYYEPVGRGAEARYLEVAERLRATVRGTNSAEGRDSQP